MTTATPKIRLRKVPALVGRREAAEILGVTSANMKRDIDRHLPPSLQEREIEGFDVTATPLWPRAEVEELAHKLGRRSRNGR